MEFKFKNNTVMVLGTEYSLKLDNEKNDKILIESDGYCDKPAKEIVIKIIEVDYRTTKNVVAYLNQVLRHELAHAFIYESSTECDKFDEESMCDWLSIMTPKIMEAYEKVKIVEV